MLNYKDVVDMISHECLMLGGCLRSRQVTALAKVITEKVNEELSEIEERLRKLEGKHTHFLGPL